MTEQISLAEKTKHNNPSCKRKGGALDPAENLQAEQEAEGGGSEAAFSQLLSFMQGQASSPAGFGIALQPKIRTATAKQTAKKQNLEQEKSSGEAKAPGKSRMAATKAATKAAAKAEKDAFKQQAAEKKQMTHTVSLAAKSQIVLVTLHDTLKNYDLKDLPEPIAQPLRTLRPRMAALIKEVNAAINKAKKKNAVIEPLSFHAADVSECTTDAKALINKFEQLKTHTE